MRFRLRYPWQYDYFNPFQRFTFPCSRYMRRWLMAKPKRKDRSGIKRPTHDYHDQTHLVLLKYHERERR